MDFHSISDINNSGILYFFVGHFYRWEHLKKSQMKTKVYFIYRDFSFLCTRSELKYPKNDREGSGKICMRQGPLLYSQIL